MKKLNLKIAPLLTVITFIIGAILVFKLVNLEPEISFAQEGTCNAITPPPGTEPGVDYVPGEAVILLREGNEEIGSALHEASKKGSTITGVAGFDSVSTAFGLKWIASQPEYSSAFKRAFVLGFSPDVDLTQIILSYCQFPFMEAVELDVIYHATAVQDNSWGYFKEKFKKGK